MTRIPGEDGMKILLAIDGSPHSQRAIDEVAGRPWPKGSVIRVFSAFHRYVPAASEFVLDGATVQELSQRQATGAEDITRQAVAALTAAGLVAEAAVREGDARSAVVDEADEWKADL